jgi:hypothetical protein
MRSSAGDTPIQERVGWLFWAIKTAGLHSHFLGLTCGLIRMGSRASAVGCGASAQAGPDPTEHVLDEDFGSYSPGAMWADTKLWAQHLKAWKKIAIVSEADWLENSVKAFGWLIPGEVKVFETDDLDDAKEWLSGFDDD